jgi:hypothetical protein
MDEPCKRSESGRDRKCRSWDLLRKTSADGGYRQQEDLRAAFMGKRDKKRETYMQKSDWAKCESVPVESRIRIPTELTIVHHNNHSNQSNPTSSTRNSEAPVGKSITVTLECHRCRSFWTEVRRPGVIRLHVVCPPADPSQPFLRR